MKILVKWCEPRRFCYYLGGTKDAATGILGELSKPLSWGMPVEKVSSVDTSRIVISSRLIVPKIGSVHTYIGVNPASICNPFTVSIVSAIFRFARSLRRKINKSASWGTTNRSTWRTSTSRNSRSATLRRSSTTGTRRWEIGLFNWYSS